MLGVEPFLIANAITLVMSQRLVRRLCDNCKRPLADPDPNKLLALKFTKEELASITMYEPVGCDMCYEGFKGRIAISEALLFTREIRKVIITAKNDIDEDAIRTMAEQNGMLSLRESGKERIKAGQTSIGEIIAA